MKLKFMFSNYMYYCIEMDVEKMLGSKIFLLVVFLILTAAIGIAMKYITEKKDENKETSKERILVYSAIISFVITFSLYYFKGRNSSEIILDKEDFYD